MDKNEFIEGFLAHRFDTATAHRLRAKIEPLLKEVLLAAWPDVEDKLHELHIDLTGGSYFCHRPGSTIFLYADQLINRHDEAIKSIVAHELAHFCLGHKGTFFKEQEEADELVRKWGFGLGLVMIKNSAKT